VSGAGKATARYAALNSRREITKTTKFVPLLSRPLKRLVITLSGGQFRHVGG
jgi:hypothetical protein